MKQKSPVLRIDQPCGQDWSAMQQNDKGRFCKHCSKTVVDFTLMSDREILQVLQKSEGPLCGRLTSQQLNRPLVPAAVPNRNAWYYRLLSGLLLLFTNACTEERDKTTGTQIVATADKDKTSNPRVANEVSRGAEGNPAKKSSAVVVKHRRRKKQQHADSSGNVIRGRVIDKYTMKPVSYVRAAIKGSGTSVSVDTNGEFTLHVPDSLLTDTITLAITINGRERAKLKILRSELPVTKEIFLCPIWGVTESYTTGLVAMPGNYAIITRKKKWWQFWKKKQTRDTVEVQRLSY